MSLTVYGAPLSPFVRKLCLCLIEKGLDYELEVVMPFGQPDWFRELNPLGRIPAFRDGDLKLADSSVICQYLEERYPEHMHLYGDGAEQRARVRWLEKYADYELAPLCTFTVFRNRVLKATMGQPCDEEKVQQTLKDKLPNHFDYFEATLGNAPYFLGEQLSMADLALASQLLNMEHGGETLDAGRWPNLLAHYERIKARASTQQLLPRELRTLEKIGAMR
ncbi:glutathione S-transferase family protein [Ectopseudomonas toyotomiensis]|uniref:Glutathione S-transferase n=1 Tax=Ectopseudomonas toyotomiensis TaxID=554344 RepID=A0A1I5UDU3_9GAMM|nr:glutathione S-transferase family protein [Pseudomonas toyotomiensis]PIA73123.1 glutathione S-transferase family protein [Pseudomonas toyotomiensis]SFP93187.1 glutathione S-transferase [Pseudomonas toyotomiensis]